MKGKQNVLSEVNLLMICYNLKRLMTILDPKELKNRLKALCSILNLIYNVISTVSRQFISKLNLTYSKKQLHKTAIT